jgi:hypothetical protein
MAVIEIRKVKNGFVVMCRDETDTDTEYVFDTLRKVMKFLKDTLEG